MPSNVKTVFLGLSLALLLVLFVADRSQGQFMLPPLPPPEEYGNILIKHKAEKAATFSHWLHRRKFTCRVCHFELEFNMVANSTEITEAANRSGRYCGAAGCHDGKTTFGHEAPEDCEKCHNGKIGYSSKKFTLLAELPKVKFGNGVGWVQAMKSGAIDPANYLTIKPPEDMAVVKPLLMEADWSGIPPALFSHKVHVKWLDCNNCHPDIFNIKKKTTKHFSMDRILKREFCGVCHLTVAFPMDDCKRCHSKRARHMLEKE